MADGRYALIVATSRYSDATLTQLEAPAHDARSLAKVLSFPGIGGFDVTSVVDEPAPAVMQEIEAFFDGRRREDLVLLYFSGHGILDQNARLYFATADTRVDRPRSTAVPAGFVNDLMSECRSRRQVLMLDCCNSGAFARGVKAGGSVGAGERFEGRGRVVITASDALQYAFEAGRVDGEGIGSVFTQVLVDGLETGAADLNGDGAVTLDELYDYVYGRVVDESPRQRPHKWAFGVEGQIVIARTGRGAESPKPSPRAPERAAAVPEVLEESRTKGRRRPLRLRYVAGALAALAAAAAVAATAVILSRDNTPDAEPTGLTAGREATLAVYEAWLAGELDSLDDSRIIRSARERLSLVPKEPIAPSPPSRDECWGDPDDVYCAYDYPDPLPMHLVFRAIWQPAGMRVAEVACFDEDGNVWSGGMAACGRLVAAS